MEKVYFITALGLIDRINGARENNLLAVNHLSRQLPRKASWLKYHYCELLRRDTHGHVRYSRLREHLSLIWQPIVREELVSSPLICRTELRGKMKAESRRRIDGSSRINVKYTILAAQVAVIRIRSGQQSLSSRDINVNIFFLIRRIY
jgi:hypothetical protein